MGGRHHDGSGPDSRGSSAAMRGEIWQTPTVATRAVPHAYGYACNQPEFRTCRRNKYGAAGFHYGQKDYVQVALVPRSPQWQRCEHRSGGKRRVELYNDMLASMAERLGYKDFDTVQRRNEVYAPRGTRSSKATKR